MCAIEVNANQVSILEQKGVIVRRDDGKFYVDNKTDEELRVLLSGTSYTSGSRPSTKIDGMNTVSVGDTYETGSSANRLFDGSVNGQQGLSANVENLDMTQTTSTTIDLSKYGQNFYFQLQQAGLVKTANGNYTKCEIVDGKMAEIAQKMAEFDSMPDKMDEVVLSGDNAVQEKIKSSLTSQGIIDESGNIIDKTKFSNLFNFDNNTITIDGQSYNFTKTEDGTQEVTYTEMTTTNTASKFKELNPEVLKRWQATGGDWKAYIKEMERNGMVSIVNGRYFTNQKGLQKPENVENVQDTSKPDPRSLVGNEKAQDAREIQLQEDFLGLYDANKANAQDTLLHTKYYKSYKALEDALISMNSEDVSNVKNKDYGNEVAYRRKGTLARAYFAQSRNMNGETVYEFASPEDIAMLQNKVNKHLGDLKKLNVNQQIDEYKTYFGDVLDTNIDSLSDAQLQQLAEAKTYNEGLTDAQVKHMASTQFLNRFNTEMNAVYNDFQDRIATARSKGDTKKVEKLERQLNEKLQKIRNRQVQTENEDRGDYAAMMARGQLNSEIAEGNFKNAASATYESIIATCPEAKTFIDKNKEMFFENGSFSTEKWQNFWLRKSSSKEDNNTEEGNKPIQDYFMSLGEAQSILRGNKNGNAGEAYVGLEAIFDDKSENALVNIARKMAETAGISTEANNTNGLRTAYFFKEMGKGAAGGLAADVLGNFVLNKIKIPYAGTVTGMASGTVHFAKSGVIQDLDRFVSNTYENGRLIDQQITEVIEEHPWSVDEEVPWETKFSKDFKGSSKLRRFTIDPWAIGVGAGLGGIKALINKNKIHDKEDKNSRVQQYSRRDYNERPSVSPVETVRTISTPKFQYSADVAIETAPVDIQNTDYKIKYTSLKQDARGRHYRDFQDKRAVVAKYYGLTGNEPYFDNLYKFVMESTNGLGRKQYGRNQYVNGTTYHFPEMILKDQVQGLENDLNQDKNADLDSIPRNVRIYYDNSNVGSLRNRNNVTKRPGVQARGTIVARRKA